jgi:hypothetical protein
MTVAQAISGTCAAHPGAAAQWACQRCGTFVCKDCERRTRPEAPPLCPACWTLREAAVAKDVQKDTHRLQVGGLVLGGLSFLHPLFMVASFIVNIRELVRGTGGDKRWMNVVGVSATGVAVLVWGVGIAALVVMR